MNILKVMIIFSLLVAVGSANTDVISCIQTGSRVKIKEIGFSDKKISVTLTGSEVTKFISFDDNTKKMMQGMGSIILASQRGVNDGNYALEVCDNRVSVRRGLNPNFNKGSLSVVTGGTINDAYVEAIQVESNGEIFFTLCNSTSDKSCNANDIYDKIFESKFSLNNIKRSYLITQLFYALLHKNKIKIEGITSTGKYDEFTIRRKQ